MRLDFSDLPLKETAFSDKPMTFIDQGPKNFLGAVMDLVAIETGESSRARALATEANRQFAEPCGPKVCILAETYWR